MKTRIILILCLVICVGTYADKKKKKHIEAEHKAYIVDTERKFQDYFTKNIINLDPIEGIYEVDLITEVHSTYAGNFKKEDHGKCIIYKEEGKQEFSTFLYRGTDYGNIGNIIRVGASKTYKWNTITGHGDVNVQLIQLDNPWGFTCSYKEDLGNAGGVYTSIFVKKYPTVEQYTTALREYEEKNNREEKVVEEQNTINSDIPEEWGGTGFALKDGYIVTNYHVIEGAQSITVKGIKGQFDTDYSASVICVDKVNDIAIIKVKDGRFNGFGQIPYKIKSTMSDVGEDVFVLGYPMTETMGEEIKLTTGVISSKSGFEGDVSIYQISAPVQPGNSGAPLFDKSGNVIGIVSSKHVLAENAGYAIKSSYLSNLLETNSLGGYTPTNNTIANMVLSNKVKALKNYVFIINCSKKHSNSENTSSYTNMSENKNMENPNASPSYRTNAGNTIIRKVTKTTKYTAVEMTSCNQKPDGTAYGWITIDKNTYLSVHGSKYTLIKAEGIGIYPDKTYFDFAGQWRTFTLYFPPIPSTATVMDLIEPNSIWQFYDIDIR